jgi:dihydropteroate synthase
VSVGLLPVRAATGRVVVMGVLNVTPDSFSDGGRWSETAPAVEHGLALWADGADIVDVGGESTRPGAVEIGSTQEAGRVLPVVAELAAAGVTVSVDTYRAGVAAAALEAGATMVNDVSGGRGDPDMFAVVRDAGCPLVIMHWRGPSAGMNRLAVYDDVVADVCRELGHRVDAAVAAGINPDLVVLDPGLGFAKNAAHNWALLAGIAALVELGLPVLVGASRKSFLGALLGDGDRPRPSDQRESATTAITTYLAEAGVWGVRVHDARAAVDAGLTVAAIAAARGARGHAEHPERQPAPNDGRRDERPAERPAPRHPEQPAQRHPEQPAERGP